MTTSLVRALAIGYPQTIDRQTPNQIFAYKILTRTHQTKPKNESQTICHHEIKITIDIDLHSR